eukprot:gnl/MRDRNA2_/MRDRNA2_201676_c0_seq1.p1 gnl/MRDRNA2_/MRDRNA2_201676_c0~~gnl/MRDRNA2_/MRDRNA2_201676_c0_seq1.p1  ORF type:complete len:489 (-),score=60.10 gnl/MRDRNA2_/MRDRNA2_201676_c0_seq1:87-1553(-)
MVMCFITYPHNRKWRMLYVMIAVQVVMIAGMNHYAIGGGGGADFDTYSNTSVALLRASMARTASQFPLGRSSADMTYSTVIDMATMSEPGAQVLLEVEPCHRTCALVANIEHTCKVWLQNGMTSCEYLRNKGCDCSGCMQCASTGTQQDGQGGGQQDGEGMVWGRIPRDGTQEDRGWHQTVDNFPNPWLDPGRCSMYDVQSFICDPDKILTLDGRQRIWEEQKRIRDSTSMSCDGFGYGFQVAVALTRHLFPADQIFSGDRRTVMGDFAYALFNRWGIGNGDCGNGVLIVMSLDLRYVYIRTARYTHTIITDSDADKIVEGIRAWLHNGDFDRGMLLGVKAVGARLGSGDKLRMPLPDNDDDDDHDDLSDHPGALVGLVLFIGSILSCGYLYRIRCPDCGKFTLQNSLTVIQPARSCQITGHGIRRYWCTNCTHQSERHESVTMPCNYVGGRCTMCGRAEPKSDSDSGGGGGFGGGSAGGGGGGGGGF